MIEEEILDENLLEEEERIKPLAPYPTIGARAVALFIDVWLLGMVLLFVFFLGVYFHWPTTFLLPFFLLLPFYKWWMEGQFGGTVGKNLLQIRVVRQEDQGAINVLTSLKRNLVLFPFFLVVVGGIYVINSMPLSNDFESFPPSAITRWSNRLTYFIMIYATGYVLGLLTLLIGQPPRTIFDKMAKTVCINVEEEER